MSKTYYMNRLEKNELLDSNNINGKLSTLIQKVEKERYTELFIKISKKIDQDDYDRKIALLKSIGFTSLQKKSVFTLSNEYPLVDIPKRLRFQSLNEEDLLYLKELIISSFQNTLDDNDILAIQQTSIEAQADEYLEGLRENYDFEYNWWHLGINAQNEVIGFVLPVHFKKRSQSQIGEGTFLYMATLPQYRGNGYVHDLLKKGTQQLQKIGISRIYSDTDYNNIPMKNAFKSVGYKDEDSVEILELKLKSK